MEQNQYTYSFERLKVWQEAKEMTKIIYALTTKFPDSEIYGITGQMRRAGLSICSNLAEGSSRLSYKDKAHYSTMAYTSAMELINQLIISTELGYINPTTYIECRNRMASITNKINALRNSQRKTRT